MLNDRLNFHYLRLNESVTAGQPEVVGALNQQVQRWTMTAGDTVNAAQSGLASLHHLILREALTLTFSDTFYVLSLCFVVAVVSVLFSNPFSTSAPPPDAH